MSPEEYFKTIPRKWIGVAAIFSNSEGRRLLVKPTYKERWAPVGGVVEAFELPIQAIMREVKEETGLELRAPKLLTIEYLPKEDPVRGDSMAFTFDGGVLSENDIASIVLPSDEISEYGFFSLEQCIELLGPEYRTRVEAVEKARELLTFAYIER